jgi:Tol biopolymer transport system component
LDPSWSPDGSLIAYTNGTAFGPYPCCAVDYQSMVYLIRADGSVPPRPLVPVPHTTDARWSPDGRQLDFVVGSYRTGALFAAATDGSGMRALTPPGVVVVGPAPWSPDGRLIAVTEVLATTQSPCAGCIGPAYRISLLDVRTGRVRGLRGTENAIGDPSAPPQWSPDGRGLAYVCRARGEHVCVTGMRGERPRVAADAYFGWSWSPDGDYLAYPSYGRRDDLAKAGVWIVGRDGTHAHQIAHLDGVNEVVWSRT